MESSYFIRGDDSYTFTITLFVTKVHSQKLTKTRRDRRQYLIIKRLNLFSFVNYWSKLLFFSRLVLRRTLAYRCRNSLLIISFWFSCGLWESILWKNWSDSWPEKWCHEEMDARKQEIWENLQVGWQAETLSWEQRIRLWTILVTEG